LRRFALRHDGGKRAGCLPGQGGTSKMKNRLGFSRRRSSLRRRAARYTEEAVKRIA
jgi:hypothetical protein